MSLREEFNDVADEWFALEAGQFPLVPRPNNAELVAVRAPMPLPVLDTEGFRRRPDAVEAAILIISQSETGRALAATAIQAGYRICVDPPSISGAGREYEDDTFGSTDHANRRINIRGGDDPLKIALVLAHELTHVSQIVEGGLDMQVSALHPLAAIRQLLAMEGDARAHEFLVALELSRAAKDDPAERLMFPQMLDVAADTIGVSMAKRVIELAKPALAAGEEPEAWMMRIFKSFYASPSLREHYESTILFSIGNVAQQTPGALRDPALFQGALSAVELVACLDSHARRPYLGRYAKSIDLEGPQMGSVSRRTQERLAALEEERRTNPETRRDKSWQGIVYTPAPPSAPKPPSPQ